MGHNFACTQNRGSGSLLSEYDVIVLMEYKLEDVKVPRRSTTSTPAREYYGATIWGSKILRLCAFNA